MMELKHNSRTVSIWIDGKPLIILSDTKDNVERIGELYSRLLNVSKRTGKKVGELKLSEVVNY
jgi:hypothetical protein